MTNPAAIYRMEDALMVIVLTPSIRTFLSSNDPAALRQAEDALLKSDLDSESKANLRRLRGEAGIDEADDDMNAAFPEQAFIPR